MKLARNKVETLDGLIVKLSNSTNERTGGLAAFLLYLLRSVAV